MSAINEWVITVSVVSITAGIILCIIPNSKLKKTYRVLIGILMLYTIMIPIIKDTIDFDFKALFNSSNEVSEQFSQSSDSLIIKSAETGTKNAVEDLLKDNQIDFEKVNTRCEINNDKIVINSITVYFNGQINEDATAKIIKEHIGSDVSIDFVKGEKNE